MRRTGVLQGVALLLMVALGGYSGAALAADSRSLYQDFGEGLGMAVLLVLTIYIFKNYVMKK